MKYPLFLENPKDGLLHYIAPDGTDIVRTMNDEGIVAYWKLWAGDEENKGRVMMIYEEIVKYGLDKRGIMCSFANGNKAYGNVILELVKRNPDLSCEYIRHDYRKKYQ